MVRWFKISVLSKRLLDNKALRYKNKYNNGGFFQLINWDIPAVLPHSWQRAGHWLQVPPAHLRRDKHTRRK